MKRAFHSISLQIQDLYEGLFGLRDHLTPPRKKMEFIGPGDFKKIGKTNVEHFKEFGNLQPNHDVLDLGCGIGRMAVPLTNYLDKKASYHGVDIVEKGIDWCSKQITSRFPNFEFHLLDIYSHRYNKKGKFKASDYDLPFENHSFDFICANSLFTHLMESDMNNYLTEIARLLRPGGTCFINYLILNKETEENIKNGESAYSFEHNQREAWYESEDGPENATAYHESYIRKQYEKNGLEIVEPIQYGKWSGRKDFLTFSDTIIARSKG